MKNNRVRPPAVVLTAVLLLPALVMTASALPGDRMESVLAAGLTAGSDPSRPSVLTASDPLRNLPEIRAIITEEQKAIASGDDARLKELEARVQAIYLRDARPCEVREGPVQVGPSASHDFPVPGPDILVQPGPIYSTSADYEMDGTMWVALGEGDSAARAYKSTNHGASWEFVSGFRWNTKSLIRKVQIVVGEGDSAFVYMFAIDPVQSGTLWAIRFGRDGSGYGGFAVKSDDDTIADFAACRDYSGGDYWLHAIAVGRTPLATDWYLRSTNYGVSWTQTQPFQNLYNPSLSAGAGRYIYWVGQWSGAKGKVQVMVNHNYGNPLAWYNSYFWRDTFAITHPVGAAAFTRPETSAVFWVAYDHLNNARNSTDLLVASSTDGGLSFHAPVSVAAFPGSANMAPDLKNYTSDGNTYVNLAYFSYDGASDYRRIYRHYVSADAPDVWSDTLRINSHQAYRGYEFSPKVVYSPGGPGSGGGCVFAHYHTGATGDSAFFNSPWATGLAERAAPQYAAMPCLTAVPNPFRDRVVLQIPVGVAREGSAGVAIFDASGRLVRRLIVGPQAAGRQGAVWDRIDDQRHKVSTGIYLARLTGPSNPASTVLIVR
jgi:hypothetical protein